MKDFLKKNSKIIIWSSVGVVVALGIGLGAYFLLKNKNTTPKDPNTIAVVGEKAITKQDLNRSIYGLSFTGTSENPEEVSEELRQQLIDNLIDFEILKQKADKLNIVLTDEEVAKQAKAMNANFDKYLGERRDILLDNAKFALLKQKVTEKVVTWSSGKFILVRTDLHFYEVPTGLPEAERAGLILRDKQAAETLINKIYSEIIAGKITFEEGMNMANNDSLLGRNAWAPYTMTWSQSFSKEDSMLKNFPSSSSNFWAKINSSKIGQVSEPMTADILLNEDSPAGNTDTAVEGMYVLAFREDGNNGDADSYQSWVQSERVRLNINE